MIEYPVNTVVANVMVLSFTDAPFYVAENACIESWVQSRASQCVIKITNVEIFHLL